METNQPIGCLDNETYSGVIQLLHLRNLEEIEALLLQVPGIVTQFENRDPEFTSSVKTWLFTVEQTFSNNRMPIASEVAVIYGEVISTERGTNDRATTSGSVGARKMRDAHVVNLLKQATDLVSHNLRSRRAQIEEAQSIMMQVVAVALHLNLIPATAPQDHTAYLQSILLSVSNRPELASHIIHVTGLLGNADTLIVLDRAIAFVQR